MKDQVIKAVEQEKLIVIVRGIEANSLIPLAEAMYNGGIRLLEITYDATGMTPDEETAHNICRLSEHFEGKMFIGAGTVLTEKQVELTKNAGGRFIISPDVNPEVIKKTSQLGLVSMPGALTPSEITAAHRAGADFVKLFPVGNLGSDYIKAIRVPLSHIRMLAVGGVEPANMAEFSRAGVCGFGVGSAIIDKKAIAAGDFERISSLAREYTELVRAL